METDLAVMGEAHGIPHAADTVYVGEFSRNGGKNWARSCTADTACEAFDVMRRVFAEPRPMVRVRRFVAAEVIDAP